VTDDDILFDGDGEYGHYQVVDCIYGGRRARVLYSGNHQAAQSGVALDGQDELLFDYNERFRELVRGLRPKRLLLIGGGAFTLPTALAKEFPELAIDIVEPDSTLLDIARRHFGYTPTARTRIFHRDGRDYLGRSADTYDMILIDAFLDTEIPSSLQTIEATHSFKRHLRPQGVLAMNVIATYNGERSQVLRRITAAFQSLFADTAAFPASWSVSLWTPQNFICTGSVRKRDLQSHLRYPAQPLPATSAYDIATDKDV
jgi:spermidine synthase